MISLNSDTDLRSNEYIKEKVEFHQAQTMAD